MLKRLVIDEQIYTKNSDVSDLERLLLQHLGLDRVNDKKIELAESELLTLKSWLIEHTEESMAKGSYTWVEHGIPGLNGGPMEVVFARGQTKAGTVVLWHNPLPWPEDWDRPQHIIRKPSALEIAFTADSMILRWDHIEAVLGKPATKSFLEVLKCLTPTSYKKPHEIPFQGGVLYLRISSDFVNFEFDVSSPRYASLCSSLSIEQIQKEIPDLERVIVDFCNS